jgi:hypothetical protein
MDAVYSLIIKRPTQAANIEVDFHVTLLIHHSLPVSINDSVDWMVLAKLFSHHKKVENLKKKIRVFCCV